MKKFNKKQRNTIYKKALNNVLAFDYVDSIFLCNELGSVIIDMRKGEEGGDYELELEQLTEFMLFKPDKPLTFSVWFDKPTFNQDHTERWEVRVFVLQMLVEMTK